MGAEKKSHDATVRVFLSRVRNLVAVEEVVEEVEEVVAARGQNAGARPATESKRADSRSLSAPASTATADLNGSSPSKHYFTKYILFITYLMTLKSSYRLASKVFITKMFHQVTQGSFFLSASQAT